MRTQAARPVPLHVPKHAFTPVMSSEHKESPAAVRAALEGTIIGERYRVERLLDEGAMGRVYVGQHIHMRKRVALKILRPELTRVPEVMARFEREAMAAAHIDHPNVATATDFGKLADGSVYLVLEFVEGHTLRTEIEKGPLQTKRALTIALQISEALGAAHALDIVHRDLKPENVMLVTREDDEDQIKVLDFGVAKVPLDIAAERPLEPEEGALTTKAGMVFGTPDYMAPEQALGQTVNGRADLYSLGVILYEMLAGCRPFKTDHDFGVLGQQLAGQIPPIGQRAPGVNVPLDLEQLVGELLRTEASKRIQTAPQLSERLEALIIQSGDVVPRSGRGRTISVVDGTASPSTPTEPAPPLSDPQLTMPRQHPPALISRFKSHLPGPLKRLPDWEILGVGAAVVVVAVALVVLFGRTSEVEPTSAPAAPAPPSSPSTDVEERAEASPAVSEEIEAADALTDEHVEDALRAGALAVDALVKRYPDDGRAHLAVARWAYKEKEIGGAVEALSKALERSAELSKSKHAATILWRGAQLNSTHEQTLALLKGPMQAKGADIIFDLATTKGVRPDVASAAKEWLDTKGFERRSSPEASIAAALYRAKSCKIRAALVKRAENVGDQRSATLLRRFAEGKGCSPDEKLPCNGCLAKSKSVAAALAAIDARQPPKPDDIER